MRLWSIRLEENPKHRGAKWADLKQARRTAHPGTGRFHSKIVLRMTNAGKKVGLLRQCRLKTRLRS